MTGAKRQLRTVNHSRNRAWKGSTGPACGQAARRRPHWAGTAGITFRQSVDGFVGAVADVVPAVVDVDVDVEPAEALVPSAGVLAGCCGAAVAGGAMLSCCGWISRDRAD